MGKHFGLGKCLDCDTCGTAFYQDPVDQNETCRDCIEDKPIPRCQDCDCLMKRDHRGTRCDECEDKHFDKLAKANHKKQQRERILREGFEIMAWDVDETDRCECRKEKRISPRKTAYLPCGEQAVVGVDFRGPDHPDGMRVWFCRSCLVEHLSDLMRYLS